MADTDNKVKATPVKRQNRNRANGRYSYNGQFERLCRCGLTLGVHTAEAPHIIDDCIDGVQRECPGFKPARTARKTIESEGKNDVKTGR